jgi:hypothetical protein
MLTSRLSPFAPAMSPAVTDCPRCGTPLEYITPGGSDRHGREAVRVLVCATENCVGPMPSDLARLTAREAA